MQHVELARLIGQAQTSLTALEPIVDRAPYTDRVLYVQATLQTWLCDPLRQKFDATDALAPFGNPYPSVAYQCVQFRPRPPPRW